jgi:hypothetical protein
MNKFYFPLLTALSILCSTSVLSQINQMQFGKNRVQYHKFFDEWSEYESENFITYWYGQGRFIGQSAAQMAEMDFEEIQKTLEYRTNDKMEIIVYADITDLHQSNIGSEETFATEPGHVKVIGEKIFIYFDGNHTHLRRQVREGIATVFINAMLFGSNLQEVVQNAISLNLPEWFKQGLIAYAGDEWNSEIDDKLRDIYQSKKYKNFNRFALAEPRLAGHAFWYYIAHQFGKANVSNLLYLTRINRSLDDAMMYVMGSNYEAISLACSDFYRKRYEKELSDATKVSDLKQLKIKNKRKLPMFQPKLSPDGKKVAYVLNEIGKWKLYIQDVQTGKRSMIAKGGTRNPFQDPDYNYPLVAWNPDNQRILVVYERRDVIKFMDYNLTDKKKKIENFQPDFQRVYSIDFMNPREMVISAGKRGFSDIYLYNINNNNVKQISNDFWDDLDAAYVNMFGHKGVIFSSNRLTERLEVEKLDTVLPVNRFDLFYKDLEDTSKNLVRISNTPESNERQAIVVDSTNFSFVSDESGVFNRQMAYLKKVLDRTDTIFYTTNQFREVVPLYVLQDSVRQFSDTLTIDSTSLKEIYKTIAIVKNNSNFNRNIIAQHGAQRVGKIVQLHYTEGLPRLSIQNMLPDSALTPNFTRFWEYRKKLQISKPSGEKVPNTSGVIAPPKETPTVPPVNETKVTAVEEPKKDTTKKIDIDNYVFQSEFDDRETPKTTQITNEKPVKNVEKPINTEPQQISIDPSVLFMPKEGESEKKTHVFRQGRIVPYRLRFKTDYFNTKLDNNLLFGGLDSYAGTPQTFSTPPMGILMKGNFKDLLEDYQLEGGIRIPTTFNGYEAYAFFDDRKHQLDRRFALYHRSQRYSENGSVGQTLRSRSQTTLAQYEVRYPFDMYRRVQATGTLRSDRLTQLATDANTLEIPALREQRIGAKIEYVFDNTLDIDMNLKNGTRYKVWVDFVKRFNADFDDKFSFEFKEGFMGVLGFDARHYERVLKHSVIAVRAAGATTFGKERTLYYLGGIDNEVFANFNNEINTPAGNYAFQTLAANLRGFSRNIRNGTSYALINSEIRIPIFKYLSSKPLTSSFWRNFQLTGFFDIGTAWHGANPFNRKNPLNTTTLYYPKDLQNDPSVVLTVNYFKDPIVASYGVGARVLIFGYMLRADYGWGIETRVIQKPMLHIALGTDF